MVQISGAHVWKGQHPSHTTYILCTLGHVLLLIPLSSSNEELVWAHYR